MTFHVGWPQVVWFALLVFSIADAAVHHGKPRKGKHSVWIQLLAGSISAALLYWGGFFAVPA